MSDVCGCEVGAVKGLEMDFDSQAHYSAQRGAHCSHREGKGAR